MIFILVLPYQECTMKTEVTMICCFLSFSLLWLIYKKEVIDFFSSSLSLPEVLGKFMGSHRCGWGLQGPPRCSSNRNSAYCHGHSSQIQREATSLERGQSIVTSSFLEFSCMTRPCVKESPSNEKSVCAMRSEAGSHTSENNCLLIILPVMLQALSMHGWTKTTRSPTELPKIVCLYLFIFPTTVPKSQCIAPHT